MLGIGRKPAPSNRRPTVARHVLTLRVAGERSACARFLERILSIVSATYDCVVDYERADNDTKQGDARIE